MGFKIKKSYLRDSKELESFYCRIESYSLDKLAGTAFVLIQYYKDQELARGYSNKYSRETHSPSLDGISADSFPLIMDEQTKINGELLKIEPEFTDFRVQSYGFFFPLGKMIKEEKHEYETIEVEIEQKYVDFDDDGNPVEMIKKIPTSEQRIVKTEIIERCIADMKLPEFQQNPHKWLYVRLKPELEKIFGAGMVEDII